MYLVDTDVVVSYLNGRADAIALINGLLPDGIAISVMSLGELYEGVYYGHDPRRQLAGLRNFLRAVRVLVVNRRVAQTIRPDPWPAAPTRATAARA